MKKSTTAIPSNSETLAGAADWPEGFQFSAGHCGIKPASPDLVVVRTRTPTPCAAVFTTNRVQAAPVRLSRANLEESKGLTQVLVVNSGNANCATGKAGEKAAKAELRAAAQAAGCKVEQVLVASTGVIGVPLDAAKITAALPLWLAREDGPEAAARALLTTDTRVKTAAARFRDGRTEYRVAGMCKGSGMIHPRMATMLGYIFTDAPASAAQLRGILRDAVAVSFNRITVDGDTSTNDMVALWSSRAKGKLSATGLKNLRAAVTQVATSLARQIVRDGEGARRFVTISLLGAKNDGEADQAARAIAHSPLVKTALAGADPNWGRVLAAAGYSGARFDPEQALIWFNGLPVYRKGVALPFDEDKAKKLLDVPDVEVRIDLRAGKSEATIWTCDLTEEYIRINGSYRT